MIDGHTKLFGLLAHPAAHSLSPLIHNTSFKVTGINGVYLAFDVTSDGLPDSLAAMRAMNIGGFNLSMPLKTDVIPLLDEITPRAERLQAVNTVINRDGRLVGDSTDGQGWVDSLKQDDITIDEKVVTVLGSGGAGRAIISAAVDAGAQKVYVFKRTNDIFESRKEQLESWSDVVEVLPYEDESMIAQAFDESQIVANSTNVGMAGDQSTPVSKAVISHLTPQHIVTDAIYFPLETPFIRAAKQQGSHTYNGIGMLVNQAAGSFLEWTGQRMPVQPVIEAVHTAVQQRQQS
ncbi:shikimate dehydrogenase [Lentilactobacillus otakiensis]|uniref:Shikimate dehydrogenase (NADP(+)) n=1 Tax=Lentilactobacillus otakiensis DSM 19908 = JCM 15040 TaxID=1423780 RepID=S4NBP2_9LACO|nr:shikimate dehydrogenase [Lentilactobacillus otakiensis]KRL10459.1 shikimate dehydrogenase [Lentilactobacillus otakiensis DSM 19908 = JCM 15040]MBZ3777127.1 shikimate dehydrogenase [Lentilactobacillus otakiensis]MDV3518151.1 shikimate dehydrogenase [Lentilactobacillus otakiensis]GAD16114.1 shikimate 5-dehydrogenase [Lentilactobacillus otakiensis DSM 19908 = JCM 15040]